MNNKFLRRSFYTTAQLYKKVKLKNAKGSSSTHWLQRQLSDPYVERAKIQNYR